MPKADGVLFCGGGTGGHVWPGLAVAAALRARGVSGLRWIGDPARIEQRLVPGAGIALLPFGLSRPRLLDPRWVFAALCASVSCASELIRRPPRAVVALGGYAALLPGLLAPLLRRPLIVLESNARPGRTNRLLARGALRTVVQFAAATQDLPRALLLGNPVRRIASAPRGRAPRLCVLVVGGSLAAKSLNDLVALAAPRLAACGGLHVVHLAGEADAPRIAALYREAGFAFSTPGSAVPARGERASAEVHGFVADMPSLYQRIDLCITRAGATTIAELACAGIGALYIPLPWAADDHQTANAAHVAAAGGARLIAQATARPDHVAEWILAHERDRAATAALGHAAAQLARPGAAAAVAELILRLSARNRRLPLRAQARARWKRLRTRSESGSPESGPPHAEDLPADLARLRTPGAELRTL